MNYIQKIKRDLATEIDVPDELLDLYTLLVFTKGISCTLKDVHNAWSIWMDNKAPKHKSLIPFEKLSPQIQEYDREYTEAIQRVAKKI